jgi:hypothetical protein
MKINAKYLNKIIEPALDDFFRVEINSILSDVSERNLCARLAMQFENQMKAVGLLGYYADPEYNRKQDGQVKTILNGNMEVVSITCDLIIHSRGEIISQDNLIAIEMAKPNKSQSEMQDDRNRLMALTKASYDGVWSTDGTAHPEHVCGYVKGIFLIVDRQARKAHLESYAHGAVSKPPQVISF